MPEDTGSQIAYLRGRPSSTALVIAAAMIFLASGENTAHLVPLETRKLSWWVLRNYSPGTKLLAEAMRHGWFRAMVRALEAATIPGIIEHYAQRKIVLGALARVAIGEGAGQLIVLGNGFDTLCCRMTTEFPGLRALAFDHQNTRSWYYPGALACDLLRAGMHSGGVNLGQSGELERIGQEYIEGGIRNFWVAEGLLMYFTEFQVREIFRLIQTHSPPGSRIAFTYLEPGEHGSADFRRRSSPLRYWLRRVGEPFQWGIRPPEVAGFLEGLGFRLVEMEPGLLAEVERLGVGEHIALAEVC